MIISPIAQVIEKTVNNNKTLDNKTKHSLKLIINFCNNPFEELDTEYKFLNFLKKKDYYDKPKIKTLDNTIDNIVLHNTNMIAEKNQGCYSSIKIPI